jgi:hypothetical protein
MVARACYAFILVMTTLMIVRDWEPHIKPWLAANAAGCFQPE